MSWRLQSTFAPKRELEDAAHDLCDMLAWTRVAHKRQGHAPMIAGQLDFMATAFCSGQAAPSPTERGWAKKNSSLLLAIDRMITTFAMPTRWNCFKSAWSATLSTRVRVAGMICKHGRGGEMTKYQSNRGGEAHASAPRLKREVANCKTSNAFNTVGAQRRVRMILLAPEATAAAEAATACSQRRRLPRIVWLVSCSRQALPSHVQFNTLRKWHRNWWVSLAAAASGTRR